MADPLDVTEPSSELSAQELAFLSGPVDTLCAMLTDWDRQSDANHIPENVMTFAKEQGFFGLRIPKEFAGLGFSNLAFSEIICNIASVCLVMAMVLSAPEAQASVEMLLSCGSEEQKQYYLPRLARGEEILCGVLSQPKAENSPGYGLAHGVVCEAEFAGQTQLCVRLSWQKHGVLGSPMASVLALAFHLHDPDRLLGDRAYRGLCCALLPGSTPGISRSVDCQFMGVGCLAGACFGNHVLIPVDWLLGSRETGFLADTFQKRLIALRMQSLSAVILGQIKKILFAAGVFSRVCRSGDACLMDAEDVQIRLARMAGLAFQVDASCFMITKSLNERELQGDGTLVLQRSLQDMYDTVLSDAFVLHGLSAMVVDSTHYLARLYVEKPLLTLLSYHCMLSNEVDQSVLPMSGSKVNAASCYHSLHVLNERLFSMGKFINAYALSSKKASCFKYNKHRLSVLLQYVEGQPQVSRELLLWVFNDLVQACLLSLEGLAKELPRACRRFMLSMMLYCFKRRLRQKVKVVSDKDLALLVTQPSDCRESLLRQLYRKSSPNNPIGRLDELLMVVLSCQPLEEKIVDAKERDILFGHDYQAWVNELVSKKILTPKEGSELITMHIMRMSFICASGSLLA